MGKKMAVDDVDAFMRRLKWVGGVFIAICVLPLIGYMVYLDRRIDDFTDSLRHNSPEELEVDNRARQDLNHQEANPVEGQVVYVPAYSHVYHERGKPHLLTITLSVRNTSMRHAIVVKSVRYFDTKGQEVKSYLKQPVRLPALGTTEVIVERDDTTGGSGANFLVEWYANTPVSEPIIEAVMIDTRRQQGISFVRRGLVVSQVAPKTPKPTDRDQRAPGLQDSGPNGKSQP